jgi:hypothetical protein
MGRPREQRVTNRIERSLNRDGGRFEVLQFASPGAETHHPLKTLATVVLESQPDFVLLQWYVNDFEFTKAGRSEPPSHLVPHEGLDARLYRASALYILLNHAWQALQISLGAAVRFEDYMRERFGDPESRDSRTAMRFLEAFVSRCGEAARQNAGAAVRGGRPGCATHGWASASRVGCSRGDSDSPGSTPECGAEVAPAARLDADDRARGRVAVLGV